LGKSLSFLWGGGEADEIFARIGPRGGGGRRHLVELGRGRETLLKSSKRGVETLPLEESLGGNTLVEMRKGPPSRPMRRR